MPHFSTVCRRARSLDMARPARPASDGPLHLAIDLEPGEIAAPAQTPSETHDGTELQGLLALAVRCINRFTALGMPVSVKIT